MYKRQVLFLAGSDAEANAAVAGLLRDLGAEPVDLGPIDQGGKDVYKRQDL